MNALEAIDSLKRELDELRPLPPAIVAQVEQKLRLEADYHSNAIEGNELTLGETRSLILHGLTAQGKSMRDHLDIEGHDEAVKAIEGAIKEGQGLSEVFIRNLHRVLLKEDYESDAVTPDGRRVKRTISVGDYKTTPNHVRTSTGETYYFTPPEQVKPAMSDLLDWYKSKELEGEHPVIIAATFHYRFVRIHPFDDGNGRMARLLMNMILIKHGYTVALIRREDRDEYFGQLELADKTERLSHFIDYIASCCDYSLSLHLNAARGESIEDVDDIDREIALFKRSLSDAAVDSLPATEYIESVLRPFFDYSQGKIRLFSDVFGSVRTSISLFVTEVDGQVVTLCENANAWPSSQVAAEQARAVSFTLLTHLTNFQGRQDSDLVIQVENSAKAHCDEWSFSAGQVCQAYKGRDLDEIKKRFNEMLREMMQQLERE